MSLRHVELLRKAKKLLIKRAKAKDYNNTFVCYCIIDSETVTSDESRDIRQWIYKIMNYEVTYDIWLSVHHPVIFGKMQLKDFAQGRIQWMNWMIKNHHVFDIVNE